MGKCAVLNVNVCSIDTYKNIVFKTQGDLGIYGACIEIKMMCSIAGVKGDKISFTPKEIGF